MVKLRLSKFNNLYDNRTKSKIRIFVFNIYLYVLTVLSIFFIDCQTQNIRIGLNLVKNSKRVKMCYTPIYSQ